MNLLFLDIETAPNTALVWGTNKQFVPVKHLLDDGHTICWSAKWYKRKGLIKASVYQDGEEEMLLKIWHLLDEADGVIHYNGTSFDIPTLNKEFFRYGWPPPSPYKEIDLYRVARRNFRLPSYKLEYVARLLGIGAKVSHKGMELWIQCMAFDDKAWKHMIRYNDQDTRLLEKVYKAMLPWITGHPNYALYTDPERPMCTNCGGPVQYRGYAYTATQTYRQVCCNTCGKWSRERFASTTAEQKAYTLR